MVRVGFGRAPAATLVSGVLVAIPTQAVGQDTAGGDRPLSYTVSAEFNEAPWGEWSVEQGPELALARAVGDDEIALLAGRSVGGLPVEPREGWALAEILGSTGGLEPGFHKVSMFASGTAVVDSVSFELREGEAHREVAGYPTRHHVLTARISWRNVAEDGAETPVLETGTADLWLAPDLPFSWIPFAVAPLQPGMALPLSYGWPELVAPVLREVGAELEELGLLLRAEVVDRMEPRNDPGSVSQLGGLDYRRSVTVGDIEPMTEPPHAAALVELPRLGRQRMGALYALEYLIDFDYCRTLASAAGGSYEQTITGPIPSSHRGGAAVYVPSNDFEHAYPLVMGSADEDRVECTGFFVPGDAPRVGRFPLAPFDPFAADPWTTAIGIQVLMEDGEVRRVLVLDAGDLEVTAIGEGILSGEADGVGWILERPAEGSSRLLEDVGLEVSFEAVPDASPGG